VTDIGCLTGDYRLSTLDATQSELSALNYELKKLLTLSSIGTWYTQGRLHQRYLNCHLVNLRLTLSGD